MRFSKNWFVALLVMVGVAYARPAYSQSADGKIIGVIKDASGGLVPGAIVTVTNQATRASQTATSGADGTYSVSVPAGTYSVAASLKGFSTKTQRALNVTAGAMLNADFSLQANREEEVTVTAMRREETVQDTPVSVAAPTEADLRERGVEDIEGVARNVAGFSVQNLGPGQSQVAMRGVSSGQIARDQPGVKEQVGVYLDESVISLSLFTPDIDLFDMSRVEVLRGPQGTLFGSGSETGTVRYISNQPELGGKAKAFGEFGGNSISGGSQGGNVKFGFNAPMGDKAALRVAAFYNRFAGYIDSPGITRTAQGLIRPDPASKDEDVNTGDRTGVRAAIKIAPNDRLTLTPRIVYQEAKADGWNRTDVFNILGNRYTTTRPAVTLGSREQFRQIAEPFKDKFFLGDLNIGYKFGGASLTSITSYTSRDVDVIRDAGALTSSITGGSIGLPERVYSLDSPLDDATKAKVFTQEIRFSGGKDRFTWVAGGFYSNTTRDYGQSLLVAGFETLTGIPTAGKFGAARDVLFFSKLHYELKQTAVFGEGTLSVNDKLSVIGGVRYYDFNEDRTQVFDGIFADPASKPGSISANGVAPRVILAYKASETTNLNAQVSKGFRLGGINDQLNLPLCTEQDLKTYSGLDNWKDETSLNYEVGSKSRVLDGRGSFNVSGFYTDIKNLQATETAGSCSSRVVLNVKKARSQGLEAEFAITPNNNFDLSISGGYTDSVIKSTFASSGGDLGIRDGARLPSVPKVQLSAAATYQWSMKNGSLVYLTGTFQHVGSRFTQVDDENSNGNQTRTLNLLSFANNTIGGPLTATKFDYSTELPSYNIANLRLGLRKTKWDAALYANNVTDEEAYLALDRERGTRARIGFLTNQPRTFGVTLRVNF
ncbi:MAG: TonB-dependent receptor [Vicinamibacteria bacterium]